MSIGGMEPKVKDHKKYSADSSPTNQYSDPNIHHHRGMDGGDHRMVHFESTDGHQPSRLHLSGNRTSSSWSRTSFKIGKPKPSKIRYLTRQEIIGISLSFLLSLVFAGAIILFFIFGTPLVINQFVYLSREINEALEGAAGGNPPDLSSNTVSVTTDSESHLQRNSVNYAKQFRNQLKLQEGLDEEEFKAKFHRQAPSLFTLPTTTSDEFNSELLPAFLELVEISTINISTIDSYYVSNEDLHLPQLSMTWEEFLSFEFSLSSLSNQHFYYACDQDIISQLPVSFRESLSSLLFSTFPSFKAFYTPFQEVCVGHKHSKFSGTSFHLNKERIHYLAQGEIHWVLFPPSPEHMPTNGFNPLRNLQSWKESIPDNPASVLNNPSLTHVIQRAGEFLYVPEGWYHASQTVSSDPTVSFTFEMEQSQANNFYYYLEEGNHRMKKEDYKRAIRMYKMGLGIERNVYLLEKLADADVLLENYRAAEELYREVVILNPINPIPYGKLIELLINHANKDISDSISLLLQQAEERGIKDEVLRLANDHL